MGGLFYKLFINCFFMLNLSSNSFFILTSSGLAQHNTRLQVDKKACKGSQAKDSHKDKVARYKALCSAHENAVTHSEPISLGAAVFAMGTLFLLSSSSLSLKCLAFMLTFGSCAPCMKKVSYAVVVNEPGDKKYNYRAAGQSFTELAKAGLVSQFAATLSSRSASVLGALMAFNSSVDCERNVLSATGIGMMFSLSLSQSQELQPLFEFLTLGSIVVTSKLSLPAPLCAGFDTAGALLGLQIGLIKNQNIADKGQPVLPLVGAVVGSFTGFTATPFTSVWTNCLCMLPVFYFLDRENFVSPNKQEPITLNRLFHDSLFFAATGAGVTCLKHFPLWLQSVQRVFLGR